jgi:AraC family transcriptional regulator
MIATQAQCVRNVVALLEAVASQLDRAQLVHATIVRAAALLRSQIEPALPAENLYDRGRLVGWQTRKVREHIDNNIAGPILVSDLCSLVDLSPAHFSRIFKRTFGKSPHAFVIRRRLELAAQYMLQSRVPLSDIALRCGFADQAHFSNQFRQASGLNPSAWRRTRGTPYDAEVAVRSDRGHGAEVTPAVVSGSLIHSA